MPLYEFQCREDKCKKEFEVLVKVSEASLPVECPECHTPDAKKKISLSSFVLEGGGWAKDGYSG